MTRLSDVNEGINQARCPCNGPGCPDCNFEVVGMAAGNAPVKDSPLVGNEGVSGTVEGHGDRVSVCETRQPVTSDVKSGRSEHQASPADSQINQGLTIERLIDSVIRAEEHAAEIEQYRAEEEAAAEEGALIEASGYPDPMYERN